MMLLRWFTILLTCCFATPDSRELLVEILGCVNSDCCDKVRRLCQKINKGTVHDNYGIGQLGNLAATNFERDLHRWANKQDWRSLLPSLYEFPLRVYAADSWQTTTTTHFAMLPHEVFGSVYREAPDLFKFLWGSSSQLDQFWQEEEELDTEWYHKHPVIQSEPDPRKRIPIGLHGDDAGMTGHEPVLIVCWNGLAVDLNTVDNRLLFSLVKVADCIDGDTINTMLSVLTWSLRALASGYYPTHDHTGYAFSQQYQPARWKLAGKLIADGIKGAWSEMRGDWKFLKEVLHLRRNYGTAPHVCHLCEAGKNVAANVYTNFADNADYLGTFVDGAEWWTTYVAYAFVCALLMIPGFWIYKVAFDIMHTVDLGIYQYMLPSVLWELTGTAERIFQGTTRQARFAAAYKEYRAWCKEYNILSVTKKKFHFKRFRPDGNCYPQMSQVTAKAAATRCIRQICLLCFHQHLPLHVFVFLLDSLLFEHFAQVHGILAVGCLPAG